MTGLRPCSASNIRRPIGIVVSVLFDPGAGAADQLVTIRLRRCRSAAWEALREDEVACRALASNTTTTKLTAFATGAMFGGFDGAFFATRQGFISPESFTFQDRRWWLAIVVLGGMGSQLGVALAALAMIAASSCFAGSTNTAMLVFGMAMVLLMIWRPRA